MRTSTQELIRMQTQGKELSREDLESLQQACGRKAWSTRLGRAVVSTWYEHPYRTGTGKLRAEPLRSANELRRMAELYAEWKRARESNNG